MNKYFISIYKLLESNQDCSSLLDELEKQNLNSKEMKSFISLKLRYFIKNNINFDHILTSNLMRRDYWLCIEYDIEKGFDLMTKYIKTIEPYDIDIMIKNKWYLLIKHWDGYPVVSSIKSNCNPIGLSKYSFNIDNIKAIYYKKIPKKYHKYFHNIINCTIFVDGANIAYNKIDFDYNQLVIIIKKLEDLGYQPKIILHEHHKCKLLKQYIIRTPRNYYDDNFLLYGLFQYNKMIVSNDLFRDHTINMNCFEKCYIDMMTIKYIDNVLIIPEYSKCIQVKKDCIYIPCVDGFYKINEI
jgi:hypothetical protein